MCIGDGQVGLTAVGPQHLMELLPEGRIERIPAEAESLGDSH